MFRRSTEVFGPPGNIISDMMKALVRVPFKPVYLEFSSEVQVAPPEGNYPEIKRRVWTIHERDFPEHGVVSHPVYFNCIRGIVFWSRVKSGESWEKVAAVVRHLNQAAPRHLRPKNRTSLQSDKEIEKAITDATVRPKIVFKAPPPSAVHQIPERFVTEVVVMETASHEEGATAESASGIPPAAGAEESGGIPASSVQSLAPEVALKEEPQTLTIEEEVQTLQTDEPQDPLPVADAPLPATEVQLPVEVIVEGGSLAVDEIILSEIPLAQDASVPLYRINLDETDDEAGAAMDVDEPQSVVQESASGIPSAAKEEEGVSGILPAAPAEGDDIPEEPAVPPRDPDVAPRVRWGDDEEGVPIAASAAAIEPSLLVPILAAEPKLEAPKIEEFLAAPADDQISAVPTRRGSSILAKGHRKPSRSRRPLRWQEVLPAVREYGQDGVSFRIGGEDQDTRTARPGGELPADQGDPRSGDLSARGVPLVDDPTLSPFVTEFGYKFSDIPFTDYKQWMYEAHITTPTGYGEGFNRDEFENEEEPVLAAKSTVTRWIPVLFAFQGDKPIVVEKVELWTAVWSNRLNYKPHNDKYREFPELAREDRHGQYLRIVKPIAGWLRHGSERTRVPINAFGWVLIDEVLRYRKISERQLLSIVAHDDKRRYELAATKVRGLARDVWIPWAMRATSGQSIPWLSHSAMYTRLDCALVAGLPAMVHGTVHTRLSSILWEGLRPDRTFNMFNMIPHFDRRAGLGQRFDNWNSLIYYNPVRILEGRPYTDEYNADGSVATPPTFEILLAASGSLNVRGIIPSNFIEKIVIDVHWVAVLGERVPLETKFGMFPAPRLASVGASSRGSPGSESREPSGIHSAGSGVAPSGGRSAGEEGRADRPRPKRGARSPSRRVSQKSTIIDPDTDLEPDEPENPAELLRSYTDDQPNSLLTIYHHSYRGASIIGWSGTKRDGLRSTVPEEITGYGGYAFLCPACGQVNASGLLLCLHCFAIYYYSDGEGRAVSPIARKAFQIGAQEAKQKFGISEEPEGTGSQTGGIGSRSEPQVPEVGSRSEPRSSTARAGRPPRGEQVAEEPGERLVVFTGSPLRALMRMVNSHFLHAFTWWNNYDDHDRADAAARGIHPFFRGSGIVPAWSGTGEPPPLPFNALWLRFVDFMERLYSREIIVDLPAGAKKLTPAQLKSIESLASNTVFGVDLTVPGSRLTDQTMADFDTRMAPSERRGAARVAGKICRVTVQEMFPKRPEVQGSEAPPLRRIIGKRERPLPPLPTKFGLGVSGSPPAAPAVATVVAAEPARGIAAPPVPSVRPCAYRDVRLRSQGRSGSRTIPSKAPPPGRPGSSSDPPAIVTGKRATSRPRQPSRGVRSRTSPIRDQPPEPATEPVQGDGGLPMDDFVVRLMASDTSSVILPEPKTTYTREEWRRYYSGQCWRWSFYDQEWYASDTGWWWNGDQYTGRWQWYPGEARSRSPLRRRIPHEP